MPRVLCIIPARGGSKRLPRKNVQPVAGKPLVAHSIEHARGSRLIERVVVSTEDDEIAAISGAYGAEVVRRPRELAGDEATSESALIHVLAELGAANYAPDLVVFLQCTSPVRREDDIDLAINRLVDSNADSCFSACRSHAFIWRSGADGVRPVNYDFRHRKREQDLEPEWRENGSIFVVRPEMLLRDRNRLGGTIVIHEMNFWSSFQIDSREELALCDWILTTRLHLEGQD
jgi:N-acylneuraminate cytidylyltransferase